MDFFLFLVFSAIYIMVIHFAIAIKREFDLFIMIVLFVIGGVVGWYMQSYEMGFVVGVVLSLVLW